MAIINYTDQLRYAGRGYLDAKMMPVQTIDDLKTISLTQRFEGLTITVLNDGSGIPQDYWLVGGITNQYWVKKGSNVNNEKIEELESKINNEISEREKAIIDLQTRLDNLSKLQTEIEVNRNDISNIKNDLEVLDVKVNELSFAPDEETIGVKKDESKTLYVKVLEKEGNILKQEKNENGEKGLFASIPVFFEDEEL